MIYFVLAVATYLLTNIGSEDFPKIIEFTSNIAFYYSLYFVGFTVLSLVYIAFKMIQNTEKITLSPPKELGMEEFWRLFLSGKLTYVNSIGFVNRHIVPYNLDKMYSQIFKSDISLERKYVEKFLMEQDYSSQDFQALYLKIKEFFSPNREWVSSEYLEMLICNYVTNHRSRIISIKKNEEFNKFLEDNK